MKKLLLIFNFAFLILHCSALSLTNIVNPNYTLSWCVQTDFLDDSTVFRCYETTNLNTPLSQWTMQAALGITNFYPLQVVQVIGTNNPGPYYNTNYYATNLSAPVVADLSRDFFVCTASNANRGESGLSDYTVLPPASPVIGKSLKLQMTP